MTLRQFLSTFFLFLIGSYILLYAFPFPLNHIPLTYDLFSKYVMALQEKYILFFGHEILGLESFEKIQLTGSGDTTYDYVRIPALFTLSFFIGLLLSLLKYTQTKGLEFYNWMLVYARYFVGLTLISYGVAKFLEGQFAGPSFYSMEILVGDISPMGLAWRFFGYSDTYKIFMGLSEIIAGLLLLIRRTSILGALVSIAVCLNIVLVNFSFDVPVKLFSSHLLLFSALILIPKIKPIFEFFLLNRQSNLGEIKPHFTQKRARIIRLVLVLYFAAFIPITTVVSHFQSQKFRTFENEWEGLYTLIDFDTNRPWNKLILEDNFMMLQLNYGPKEFWNIQEIKDDGVLVIKNQKDESNPHELKIKKSDDEHYEIQLRLGNKTVNTIGKRKEKSSYELTKRGFHWINEYPYNR
ncbi:hypothetical protein [Algoriphagus formosus]|uniref:DoxX family protein n=1 Tax=Algoriphagus formosus TaxID=2007308 RepID=A0A4R5V788_9BACT|nr:hypothetical protein [Algoriphagus aquimaris]TDK47923.1 hypothetical protein E1898_04420 [Algoriphagus aquimaris]